MEAKNEDDGGDEKAILDGDEKAILDGDEKAILDGDEKAILDGDEKVDENAFSDAQDDDQMKVELAEVVCFLVCLAGSALNT